MSVATPAVAVAVDVLGPLALHVDGEVVEVPGKRRRAVLATLSLAGGRVVGAERLIDVLWPEAPPDGAVQALYNHISRLRGHLGPAAGRLRRVGNGYVLDLAGEELDVARVRELTRRLDGSTPEEVAAHARAALALWRGRSLEEFADLPALEAEAAGLDELQLRLRDELVDALVALGEPGAVAEATSAATSQPLRERTSLLLMRALAREGRNAEAMAVGAAFRRALAEETGLDPGPSLAALEEQIATGRVEQEPSAAPLFATRRIARPSGPLVGRQQDREEILRLLRDHRIVTVAGPGGVGKTRLAIDIAAELAQTDGSPVAVVDLAAVEDAGRVCQSVASTLGLRTTGDVTPEDVAEAIGDGALLLVLDNCEHVEDACRRLVSTLDARAPRVRVLATSRVTLHAAGEYVVRIQPLPVPRVLTDAAQAERQPSVRAFLEHVRRRHHGFGLAAADLEPLLDVLRQLDGLPLAIELAAGQATLMPLTAVRDRLGRALDLRTDSGEQEDHRQRTLRRTIQWSYDLLSAPERALLRSLAPFPGGVDLDAVEGLAREVVPDVDPLRVLHRLVDASLVAVDDGLTRYRLLFTVRAFLLDELVVHGESADAEGRFLGWALETAVEVGADLFGPDEAAADRRLRTELDNLRAARDLARHGGDLDTCLGITVALDEASIWRDLRELWSWCLELADDPLVVGHPSEIRVVGGAAEASRLMGDFAACVALAERGLAIDVDEERAEELRSSCVSALGAVAHFRGEFDDAVRWWSRAGRGRVRAAAGFLSAAALSACYAGERDLASRLLAEAREENAVTRCGSHRAFCHYVDGELVAVDDPAAAIPSYLQAIEEARLVGANFIDGVTSVALASAQARTGDHGAAATTFAWLLEYWSATGHQPQLWTTARNAVPLLVERGHDREAALLLLRADMVPSAAVVDREIARHSGRVFTPVTELFEAARLDELREEAVRLGSADVVALAREALADIAAAS